MKHCDHPLFICFHRFSIVHLPSYFYTVKQCHPYFVGGTIQILSTDWSIEYEVEEFACGSFNQTEWVQQHILTDVASGSTVYQIQPIYWCPSDVPSSLQLDEADAADHDLHGPPPQQRYHKANVTADWLRFKCTFGTVRLYRAIDKYSLVKRWISVR